MIATLYNLIPLAATTERLWYALPLLVSVSLVYAATRHEEVAPIIQHAVRFGLWIVVFMAVVAGIVQFTTWTL
jgi:hypothetical protein